MKRTKEAAIAAITRFVKEFGKYPHKKDYLKYDYLYPPSTSRRLMGNLNDSGILEQVYQDNPVLCENCSTPIEFEHRHTNRFCNRSCAASFNNRKTPKRIKAEKPDKVVKIVNREYKVKSVVSSGKCVHCNSSLKLNNKIFCSLRCQADHRLALSIQAWLVTGKTTGGNRSIRNYLQILKGNKCSVCGIEDYNNKPITFEVDHINGDSTNNCYENVRLICPNCHSQTDTYKGKNRGNGRFSRSKRYREGKSY